MKRSLTAACALLLSCPLSALAQGEACFEDAECPENYFCDQPPSGCPEPGCVPEPQPGTCEADQLLCTADEHCPSPSVCNGSECVFDYQLCEADAECGAGYLCAIVGSYATCSATTSSAAPPVNAGTATASTGASGTEDPDPTAGSAAPIPAAGGASGEGSTNARLAAPATGGAEPAQDTNPVAPADEPPGETPSGDVATGVDEDPSALVPAGTPPQSGGDDPTSSPEPICDAVQISACIPAPIPCTSDAECDGDWVCREVPQGGPEEWEGVTQACLPPGFAALIDGHIQVNPESLPEGAQQAQRASDGNTAMNSNGLGPDGTPPTANPGSGMVGGGSDGDLLEGTQGGSEGAATSGCSVVPSGAEGSRFALGVAALALFGLARRRRRVS